MLNGDEIEADLPAISEALEKAGIICICSTNTAPQQIDDHAAVFDCDTLSVTSIIEQIRSKAQLR